MQKKNKKEIRLIAEVVFLIVTLFVIVAEYRNDKDLLLFCKPLVGPLLCVIYFLKSQKPKFIYPFALIFAWLANIFFIYRFEIFIFGGATAYLVYWMIITYIILVNTKFPNPKLFTLAVIPFLFFYFYVLELVYVAIFDDLFLYLSNGVFMVFLAGYSLSLYMMDSSKVNTYLFVSVLMFVFVQFIVSIDLYYLSIKVFRPIAFLLYATGQFMLLKVIALFDKQTPETIQ